MGLDTQQVLIWVQLGTKLFQVGSASWESIRNSIDASDDETAARIAEIDVEYNARIAMARAAATGVNPS